ncbi:DoxX family membrane protein [Pedobacter sp. PWIIR3]
MKSKILFVVSLLFGLMMINAGLNKFFNYMPMPEKMPAELMKAMTAFMQIGWLMPLTGLVEVIGGILFIIPKTRALGAIVIFPIVIGILCTNTITDRSGLPIALVMLAINLWVLVENRRKYLPMLEN